MYFVLKLLKDPCILFGTTLIGIGTIYLIPKLGIKIFSSALDREGVSIPGLVNVKNSCYANSIIQALFASFHFTNWLKNVNYNSEYEVINEFKSLLSDFENSYETKNQSILSAHNFCLRFSAETNWNNNFYQEDCHEFIQHLYNSIVELDNDYDQSICELQWIHSVPFVLDKNLIHFENDKTTTKLYSKSLPFTGRYCILTECKFCEYKIPFRIENMNCIDLIMPPKHHSDVSMHKTIHLEHLLSKHNQPEILLNSRCQFCKTGEFKQALDGKNIASLHRQYRLLKVPLTLCIKIQRIGWTSRGAIKDERHIQIPNFLDASNLLFTPFSYQQQEVNTKRMIYSLRAIVVHYGPYGSGHYVCFRKGKPLGDKAKSLSQLMAENSEWYYTSDSVTFQIKWDKIKNQNAYLLFYDLLL